MIESVRMESRLCSKSAMASQEKKIICTPWLGRKWVSETSYLWNQDKSVIEQHNILPTNVSKPINLIPSCHTRITRFHAEPDSELTHHWAKLNQEKIPPHHDGKAEGLGDCQGPQAVCLTIWVEWLEDSWLSSTRLPLLEAVEGAASQCIPGMGLRPSPGCTSACCGNYSVAAVMQTPIVATLEPESRKWAPVYRQTSGRVNSERETCLQRTHGIVSICLKRHLGMR